MSFPRSFKLEVIGSSRFEFVEPWVVLPHDSVSDLDLYFSKQVTPKNEKTSHVALGALEMSKLLEKKESIEKNFSRLSIEILSTGSDDNIQRKLPCDERTERASKMGLCEIYPKAHVMLQDGRILPILNELFFSEESFKKVFEAEIARSSRRYGHLSSDTPNLSDLSGHVRVLERPVNPSHGTYQGTSLSKRRNALVEPSPTSSRPTTSLPGALSVSGQVFQEGILLFISMIDPSLLTKSSQNKLKSLEQFFTGTEETSPFLISTKDMTPELRLHDAIDCILCFLADFAKDELVSLKEHCKAITDIIPDKTWHDFFDLAQDLQFLFEKGLLNKKEFRLSPREAWPKALLWALKASKYKTSFARLVSACMLIDLQTALAQYKVELKGSLVKLEGIELVLLKVANMLRDRPELSPHVKCIRDWVSKLTV